MILQFSKNIILDDWYAPNDPTGIKMWYRKLIPYEDYDSTIMVSVGVLDVLTGKQCYANFYSQLAFLHKYFPFGFDGDLEFAKNYVDKYLIRMSGLTAFF